jgi:hypothetical protein
MTSCQIRGVRLSDKRPLQTRRSDEYSLKRIALGSEVADHRFRAVRDTEGVYPCVKQGIC